MITETKLKILYSNVDQFPNKREDLLMMIADDEPNIIMITGTIPKAQVIPLTTVTIAIPGYTPHMNFYPDLTNMGSSGKRGINIYLMDQIKVIEVEFLSDFEEQL